MSTYLNSDITKLWELPFILENTQEPDVLRSLDIFNNRLSCLDDDWKPIIDDVGDINYAHLATSIIYTPRQAMTPTITHQPLADARWHCNKLLLKFDMFVKIMLYVS